MAKRALTIAAKKGPPLKVRKARAKMLNEPKPGPVTLPGEKKARKAESGDSAKAASLLYAAATRVNGGRSAIFDRFGAGVPVTLSIGISVGADGRAAVKVGGNVDGRLFEIEG